MNIAPPTIHTQGCVYQLPPPLLTLISTLVALSWAIDNKDMNKAAASAEIFVPCLCRFMSCILLYYTNLVPGLLDLPVIHLAFYNPFQIFRLMDGPVRIVMNKAGEPEYAGEAH